MKILLFLLLSGMAAMGQYNYMAATGRNNYMETAEGKNYTASLDSFMNAEVRFHHFNGNVLIARDGKPIYERNFGYSHYESKTALDNSSVFELCSVSKQFTAMAILQLMEKGKLALSDTLRKFFPELPYSDITIQHLLTHTSGLPDYIDNMSDKWDHKKIAFNKDVIAFLAAEKTPVDFKPSEKCEYSNTGYEMLASIIEKTSGQSYQEYLQEHIFTPLGMRHTRVYNTRRSGEKISDYAYGYVYSDSLKRYVLPDVLPAFDFVYFLDGIVGDGCVNSTTGDLLKWDRALKDHKLLTEASQEEMFSPHSLLDPASKVYYGYGQMVGENEIGRYITHSGGWPGYRTNLVRYVDKDLTVIILSNNESNATAISGALTYILMDRTVVMPYIHKAVEIEGSVLDKYLGNYLIPGAAGFELVKKDGKLFRRRANLPDVQLIPESATKFFYGGGNVDQQIEFELDTSGAVSKTYFISWGMKKEMTKK